MTFLILVLLLLLSGAVFAAEFGCTDTDNGKDVYTQGTVSGPYIGTPETDICWNDAYGYPGSIDGPKIREFFCSSSGTADYEVVGCPDGGWSCKDGRCLQPVGCDDPDDPNADPTVAGTATMTYSNHDPISETDGCKDAFTAIEFYCDMTLPAGPAGSFVTCPADKPVCDLDTGACIATGGEEEVPGACVDTDGNDQHVKGSVTYNGETAYDYCFDEVTVAEQFCNTLGKPDSTQITCAWDETCYKLPPGESDPYVGYQNGKCVPKKKVTKCIASDGGDNIDGNIFEKGTSYFQFDDGTSWSVEESCVTDKQVNEWVCLSPGAMDATAALKQTDCPETYKCYNGACLPEGWFAFCQNDVLYCSIFPISVLIVIIMLAILYMLSQVMMAAQLEAWVRLEIRELLAGAVLALIVIALFTGAELGPKFLTDGKDMAVLGAGFLDGLNANLAESYQSAIEASHYLTALSGYMYTYPAVPLYYGAYTHTASLSPGVSIFLPALSQAAQGIANTMFVYSAMKILLHYFTSPALIVPLVSLGLTFRIIPFTRQLGNTLIALAIGAGIIFPFSILLMQESHNMIVDAEPPMEPAPRIASFKSMEVDIPDTILFFCAAGIDFFGFEVGFRQFLSLGEIGWGLIIAPMCLMAFGICWQIVTQEIYPIVALILQVVMGFRLLLSSGANMGEIIKVLQPYLQAVSNLVVLSYIDVLVVSIVTIVGTKSVSTAIGGEYYLVGLQRLV